VAQDVTFNPFKGFLYRMRLSGSRLIYTLTKADPEK
jgi:hypothetical protein